MLCLLGCLNAPIVACMGLLCGSISCLARCGNSLVARLAPNPAPRVVTPTVNRPSSLRCGCKTATSRQSSKADGSLRRLRAWFPLLFQNVEGVAGAGVRITSLTLRRERHGRLLTNLGCYCVPLVACCVLLACHTTRRSGARLWGTGRTGSRPLALRGRTRKPPEHQHSGNSRSNLRWLVL